MELQELVARGRFVLSGAAERQQVFSLVNGRRSTKDIAKECGRTLSNTTRDLRKLRDVGLIEPKSDKNGNPKKADGATVYQKVPIVRHLSLSYFRSDAKLRPNRESTTRQITRRSKRRSRPVVQISIPTDRQIIDVCTRGEDQQHEFKAAGAEMRTLAKEIAAFLHSRDGGIILYGVEDDGSIKGASISKQQFDQAIQNSIRNLISPAPGIKVHQINVLGTDIIVIVVTPWNRKNVFYYEGRVYLRKGTNVFQAKPEEIKQLHKGEFVS